jgi:hypothetical protein
MSKLSPFGFYTFFVLIGQIKLTKYSQIVINVSLQRFRFTFYMVTVITNGETKWQEETTMRVKFKKLCRSPSGTTRLLYEGRLQSWWTHIITPSRNFVEVRWRSLFRNTPLASDALLTTLHPLLENVMQTVCSKLQEDSGTGGFDLGAPFSWLEDSRNSMGRDLNCMVDVLMGFHRSRWAHPLPLFNLATLTLH